MIIFVTGKPRTGKTLLISLFGLYFADLGFQVYCNYQLDKAQEITPYEFVCHLRDAKPQEKPVFYCLHEIFSWFSSHKSFSDINELGAVFLCQAEKLNRHFFIDSQITKKVDDNFRKLANKRYEAEKLEDSFLYHELDVDFPDDDVRTGECLTIPFTVVSQYWNRYDAYSRNMPLGFTDLLTKLQKLEPKLMNDTINHQVNLLRGSKQRFFSLVSVEDFLLQNNESPAFAKYVYNRIKR